METATEKSLIIQNFIRHFEDEYQKLLHVAKTAHEDATHEEAQSEDKHDTRAIEAAYLAKGQAKRLQELEDTLRLFKAYLEFTAKLFTEVASGCLVKFQEEGKPIQLALISDQGGGARIQHQGISIQIINPHSPLGELLSGCKANDELTFEFRGVEKSITILQIT